MCKLCITYIYKYMTFAAAATGSSRFESMTNEFHSNLLTN